MVASSSLFNSLPPDLLTEEIFLRLPSNSLLRCKSVCKEWYAIISTKSFVDKHYNHPANRTRLLLYQNTVSLLDLDKTIPTSYSYFPDVDTCERHQAPDNLVLWGEVTFLRGPCNGIYCIHIKKNRFALWNPTTRRFRPILCNPSYKFDEVGFGVDPITEDFKIVLIRSLIRISPCFAVYTSSNHSWRYSEQESLSGHFSHISTRTPDIYTFVNGNYYWMIQNQLEHRLAVLAFDLHTETFQQIETPPEVIAGEYGGSLHLFNDSLALLSTIGYDTEIWLLEDIGCWTKNLSVVLPVKNALLYGLWGGNKVLLEIPEDNQPHLAFYDLDSSDAKQLSDKRGHDERRQGYLSIHYKESLASVKGEHGIEDYDTRSVEGLEFLGYEGPYTMVDFYVHREDAQIGTEEEEALRYDPSLDYPEENWEYPDENHHPHPDTGVAQVGEEEVYSCIPYDPYYYNDEDYLHPPGMEEDWRYPYANDHLFLGSQGNPHQHATGMDYGESVEAGYQHQL